MIAIAAGYDGSIRIDTKIDTSGFNKGVSSFSGGLGKVKGSLGSLGSAISGAFKVGAIVAATKAVVEFGAAGVKASTELTNAMMGLQSIVEGQGRSFEKAKDFLNEYVSDGLIPMTNAVTAYKNLAARGYNDNQIESVMAALKDSAAYGRQSSLSMGDAVQSATEGLKNENSILVDNAGVTKNVAKMWDEYAKSIGTTANNLTQEQKIQAEVNGIMTETRFQTGDAAKVAGSFSGQLAQLSFHFNELKVAVGDTLIPILEKLLPILDAIVQGVTWVFEKLSGIVKLLVGQTEEVESSAGSAADAEDQLAGSIQNASKAAKKALANFDDLNILQLGLSSNDTNIGSGATGAVGDGSLSQALDQTNKSFGNFGDGVAIAKTNLDKFQTALETVKEAALRPIKIPAPVVKDLPDPVYRPNWGLDTPLVKLPVFPVLPSPIYMPNWGLEVPHVALPAFPMLPSPVFSPVWGLATSLLPELATVNSAVSSMPLTFQTVAELVAASVLSWSPATSTAATSVLTILGGFARSSASNISAWGINVMENYRTTMQSIIDSTQAGLTIAGGMFASWINSTSASMAAWGNNLITNIATAVSGLVSTIGSGLSSAWASISGFAKSVGATIGEWWDNNKSWVVPVAAVGLAGLAVGAVVFSGGAALPTIATMGSAVLATVPALADGAVIPPNRRFLAELGDQTSGVNIESPLSTMVDAFTQALDARGASSGGEITIRIIADGKLARALKTEMDNESRRRGVKLVKGGAY